MLAEHGALTEHGEHEPEPRPLRQRDRVPVSVVPRRFCLEALDLLSEAIVDEGTGFGSLRTRLPRLRHVTSSLAASARRRSSPSVLRTAWTCADTGNVVRTGTCSPVASSVTGSNS